MAKVMRYMIADYLKTGSTPSDTYSLMGTGFTTLDENPAAKVEKTPYINDKSASGTITGYENSFAFDTQMISDDAAISFLYDIARNQKTGSEIPRVRRGHRYHRRRHGDREGGGQSAPGRQLCGGYVQPLDKGIHRQERVRRARDEEDLSDIQKAADLHQR